MVIHRGVVKKGEIMVGALAVVLVRNLALLAGRKRGHQSFPGRWVSDGRPKTVEPTSSAVDLLSIKSGLCPLLIASNECRGHRTYLR